MSTRRRRHLRRADLFLVRMWTENPATPVDVAALADLSKSSDGTSHEVWSGSVQRVVDGEAHQFNNLQGLVDTLLAMLSDTRG